MGTGEGYAVEDMVEKIMTDNVKGLLDELNDWVPAHKEAAMPYVARCTAACGACILDRLRAAVESHYLPVDWRALVDERDKAERERDELKLQREVADREIQRLKHRLEGAHAIGCDCEKRHDVNPRCLTLREEKK